MNTTEIKEYAEAQLQRNERLIPSERTSAYYEDEIRLRELWLRADANEQLEFIGSQLDSIQSYLGSINIGVEALNPGR